LTPYSIQGSNSFHLLTSTLDKSLQAHPTGYVPFSALASGEASSGDTISRPTNGSDQIDDDQDDEEEMSSWPKPSPPGFDDPTSFTKEQVQGLLVLMKGRGMLKRNRLVKFGVSHE
jgi:arginine-tRNA-protein transferase